MSQKKRGRGGFRCSHCGGWVPLSKLMGTRHRNQCPFCLWSQHADLEKSGDRKSRCQAGMEPIGLTFKHEGTDKYGRSRQGELMLIHQCTNRDCGKISINRIAGDDDPEAILDVFQKSQTLSPELKERLGKQGIDLLTRSDEEQIRVQLWGCDRF